MIAYDIIQAYSKGRPSIVAAMQGSQFDCKYCRSSYWENLVKSHLDNQLCLKIECDEFEVEESWLAMLAGYPLLANDVRSVIFPLRARALSPHCGRDLYLVTISHDSLRLKIFYSKDINEIIFCESWPDPLKSISDEERSD